MDATITIEYAPRNAVPAAAVERAAWLDRHGAPPARAILAITLPLRRWAEIRGIRLEPDGEVRFGYEYAADRLRDLLCDAALRLVCESGQAVEALPDTILNATLAAHAAAEQVHDRKRAEAEAEAAAERARTTAATAARHQRWREKPADQLIRWDMRAGAWTLAIDEAPYEVRNEIRPRAEAEIARRAAATFNAVTAWLATHGDQSQRERWAENVLPEQELRDLARDVLLKPLADFAAYTRIRRTDIEHDDECAYADPEFDADDWTGPMNADQWSALQAIRTAAATIPDATVTIRAHVGKCTTCHVETRRLSAHVEVAWHNRVLSREFAL